MKTLAALFLCLSQFSLMSQSNMISTIEVSGEAKTTLQPDEIIANLNIREYWKEEFQKGKKEEDFRTKVSITDIETAVIAELNNLGVTESMIRLVSTGNYWREKGKDFLMNKTIELKLESIEQLNDISNKIETRGINGLYISRMIHHDMELQKLTLKIKAIEDAKIKAEKMAAALGKEIDDIVSVVDMDGFISGMPRPQANFRSAAMAEYDSSGGHQYDNYKMIQVSSSVRTVWSLK